MFLKTGASENYSIDRVVIIAGKEGTECFTLKEKALLDVEGLGKVK